MTIMSLVVTQRQLCWIIYNSRGTGYYVGEEKRSDWRWWTINEITLLSITVILIVVVTIVVGEMCIWISLAPLFTRSLRDFCDAMILGIKSDSVVDDWSITSDPSPYWIIKAQLWMDGLPFNSKLSEAFNRRDNFGFKGGGFNMVILKRRGIVK